MVNWIDLVIILLLSASAFVAVKIGFYRLILVLVGFFAGLFFAGYIFPHFLPIKDDTLKFMINCNLVLLFAIYTGVKGFDIGHKLKKSIKHPKHHMVEAWMGALVGCLSTLFVIWLLAVAVGRMPFTGLSNSVNDAYIVQTMNSILPPVPAIFSRFDRLIDPNATPQVYQGHQPKPEIVSSKLSTELTKISKDSSGSVVRVTGFGCGGLIAGSGFVVAPNLVMTNAHVISGVKRPVIKDGRNSYEGRPVLFNAGADVAILKTNGFSAQPLIISPETVKPSTKLVVLGYPNGNYTAREGQVISIDNILISNIYGIGDFGRKIYAVSADMRDGNSGGPVMTSDGKVVGMVFSRAHGNLGLGYASTSDKFAPLIEQALKSNRKVSTGACLK